MELYVFEFGSEDVHLGAIFKNDLIIEVQQCFLALFYLRVFNKGLPHLCFLKDEDLDDGPIGAKQLVKVVVGDDVAELVVDAYEQDRTLGNGVVTAAHITRE